MEAIERGKEEMRRKGRGWKRSKAQGRQPTEGEQERRGKEGSEEAPCHMNQRMRYRTQK